MAMELSGKAAFVKSMDNLRDSVLTGDLSPSNVYEISLATRHNPEKAQNIAQKIIKFGKPSRGRIAYMRKLLREHKNNLDVEISTDVHRCNGVLSWILNKIETTDKINESNKTIIFQYHNYMISQSLKPKTRSSYLSMLYRIGQIMTKDFSKVDEKDINSLLSHLNEIKYSEHTREKFKRTIKKFFAWLGRDEMVNHIKTMSKSELYALCVPEVILTREEVRKVINGGRNLFEKTLLAVFAESGCRAEEILTLKTKSVIFDKVGAKITVNGKTGKRVVRLVRCKCNHENLAVNLLGRLIDYDRKYIFEKYNHMLGCRAVISYYVMGGIFERLRASKITSKHLHCHLLRHTKATQLSPFLSYTQLCDFFGWKYGSNMPSIYIRANNVALDNALLRGYKMEENEPETLCNWC